jgi:AcrR family transcriptional regulator
VAGIDPPPGLRADARRNRAALLAAARAVFAEQGVDAPLDDVARRAGLGNATLYRHFPTRGELLVAAYAEEVAALCDLGRELLAAPDAGEALFEWLGEFVSHVASKRALAFAITDDAGERATLFGRWHHDMRATVTALLDRARAGGTVRADVDGLDLLALANGIALAGANPDDPAARDRIARLLALVRAGTDPR